MPFAVVALVLGTASLGGVALSPNARRAATSGISSLDLASFEATVVLIGAVAAVFLMLWPGALVRCLYGRRPPLPGALTSEERAMSRFDRLEAARLRGEAQDEAV